MIIMKALPRDVGPPCQPKDKKWMHLTSTWEDMAKNRQICHLEMRGRVPEQSRVGWGISQPDGLQASEGGTSVTGSECKIAQAG